MLERLETKRLILRSGNHNDRRVKVLRLTREGEAVLVQAEPLVERAQMRILAPLPPDDRQAFLSILARLVESNNEASRAPLRLVSAS